jgi:hypothetical protein
MGELHLPNGREMKMSKLGFAAKAMFAVPAAVFVTISPPATAEVVRAVEYYHQAFEHYFVTANPAEIAALDSGAVSGWWRTGQRYRVDTVPGEGLVSVCRFYTSAYAGKASHFFTASAAECAVVKTMPDWTYEGVAFYVRLPDPSGVCGAGTAAINRLFNNGQGGAPNHAYTADSAKRDKLVYAGWASEGVVFCTSLADGDPLAKTMLLAGSTWDFPATEIYDFGRVVTNFSQTAAVYRFGNWVFPHYGLPLPTASITHAVNSAWWGAAAWDPLAGAYVVFGGSGFEGEPARGNAWTFDDAEGPSASVCAMGVYMNPGVGPYGQHPFQPILWSGCESGIAYRR